MKELNDCTIEELKDLARQGQRFETMRDEYNQTSDKLLQIATELKELATKINPMLSVKKDGNAKYVRGERKEIVEEFYQLMSRGSYVTRDLIEKACPDKDSQWISNTLWELQKLPNVEKTKDGKIVRLFMRT